MVNIPEFSGTFSFQNYNQVLERINKFNNVENFGKDQSGQYDMKLIKLGNVNKPPILFISSLHPTEFQTTMYGLSFFESLRDNTYPDTELRNELLNDFLLLYIPIANPYGYNQLDDIYEPNYNARYNVNYVELNNDFYKFSQAESVNIKNVIDRYKPFSITDMHAFQPNYASAYGRNLIIATGKQNNKQHAIRDEIVSSIESYSGFEVTKWVNVLSETSGLLRAYGSRSKNPYTVETLSYITEIVKPQRVNGTIVRKLTNNQIYKFGMGYMHSLSKTSIDYFKEIENVNYREDGGESIIGDELIYEINTPYKDVYFTRDNQGIVTEILEVFKDGRKIKNVLLRENGVVKHIDRIRV